MISLVMFILVMMATFMGMMGAMVLMVLMVVALYGWFALFRANVLALVSMGLQKKTASVALMIWNDFKGNFAVVFITSVCLNLIMCVMRKNKSTCGHCTQLQVTMVVTRP